MSQTRLEKLEEEYPKAAMIIDWVMKHYPDDSEAIAHSKVVGATIASPEYTPEQVYKIIDKIAILNGWVKWGPLS